MLKQAEVIISGFADEGPLDKRAEAQLTMLAALGMSYYSLRFIDLGNGVKNVMKLNKAEVRRLKKLHGEFSIKVSSIGSPIGKVKLLDVDDAIAVPACGQGQILHNLWVVGEEFGMVAQVVRHLVAGHFGAFGRRLILCRRVIVFSGHCVLFPASQSYATC